MERRTLDEWLFTKFFGTVGSCTHCMSGSTHADLGGDMRKLLLAVSAFAVFGLAAPVTTSAKAEEGKVIIKERSHHPVYGRFHDRDNNRRVITKERSHHSHDGDNDRGVIIKNREN
jgi:hypothetical protein